MRSVEWIPSLPPLAPLAGVLVACSVAACSALTSFDGLTGGSLAEAGSAPLGPDGAPPADASGASQDTGAGPPGSDAGAGDDDAPATSADSAPVDSALTDSATADSSSAPDAGADAGHDAAPPSYCATLSPAPLFCDDFDEGALPTPWDQITGTNGAVSLTTTFSVSSPGALLASVKASAPRNSIDVAAYKSFPAKQGVVGVYTMAFDIRVESVDTSSASDATLANLQLWNGSAYWDLQLEVGYYYSSTGDLSVWMTEDDPSKNISTSALANLPLKTWTRVSLTLDLVAGAGAASKATLSFNGTLVAGATVHVSTSNPIPEVVLGSTYATPGTAGWVARYDNVTFD